MTHQQRIQEIRTFFKNNDIELGFRRMLDAVMDTQQMEFYKDAIALTNWKHSENFNTEEFLEKTDRLLEKIGKFEVISAERSTILKASNISKTYGGNNFTLGPVSTEMEKGKIYGLVGENGNGKTTLLRVLAKELAFDKGEISYNFNETLSADFDLRTKLVYIPQRTQKWFGSLQDNLKFVLSNYGIPAEEIETRMLMMVARFGLWEYKDLKWSELSSGYKMRFELARTMLRKPEVLLLDEPLANLDVLAQQIVLEDLKSIGNSISHPIAIILSSQQLYEVEKVSDKVVFLKEGKQTLQDDQTKQLIIEIETSHNKSELATCFEKLDLTELSYNGGVFFAYFDDKTTFNEVMYALAESNIEIIYLRNISNSTRRYFV